MSRQWSGRVGCVVVGLLVVGSGCLSRPVGSYGIQQRSTSFSHASDEPIPGIDEGSVTAVTMLAGAPAGVPFVIWSDISGTSGGGGGGQATGAYYRAETRDGSGRAIRIEAVSKDGVTGTMTIDGTSFPIEEGGLFLLSLSGDQPRVLQLDVEIAGFPTDRDGLLEIADNHPEVSEFFRQPPVSEDHGSGNHGSGDHGSGASH